MKITNGIHKEITEGLRSYRFLIIFIGFVFLAISLPLMNKFVMPLVMKAQFPDLSEEAIMSMAATTQLVSIRGYLQNAMSVGVIITIFVLSGVVAQEIKDKTWIIPISSGKGFVELITAKLLVLAPILFTIPIITSLISYFYSGVVFGFDFKYPLLVFRAGLFHGVYMIYILGLLLLFGSIIKRPTVTGLIVLVISQGTGAIGNLLSIDRFLPSGLIQEASALAVVPATAAFTSLIATIGIFSVSVILTIIRLNKVELTQG